LTKLIIYKGKKVSCGAIVLYCLNLPPHLRYKPENVFICGISPPPNAPDTTTISHLLDPVLASVAKYHGVTPPQSVATSKHPDGTFVQLKVAPLIADLEGSRKISGFLSHSAIMFCSFCLCTLAMIENLDFQNWQIRNGVKVREQAYAWLNATTKSAKEAQEKESGVRWSSLYHLSYWDPVKHIVLGFMHNWLEGILEDHLRILWGIGRDSAHELKANELDNDEIWTETDVSDSAEELEDLFLEAEEYERNLSNSAQDSPSSSTTPTMSAHSTPLAMPSNPISNIIYVNELEENEDDHDDHDFIPTDTSVFKISDSQLQAIHNCIRDVALPTWVQRPPINLGDPSHGKLKAREYLTLFTCIFPLIIPEFWHSASASELDQKHLECFHHLVTATNIISSFKTSNAAADTYMHHYIEYRKGIQHLFPQWPSKPNHHYAMHNGELLKY
jgi:hypothetical protein